MTATLHVERHGHVNLFAGDYDAVLAHYRGVFGAAVFREWEEKEFGGRNALWLAGGTCFELFAATRPDQAIGAWLAKQGPGWHSVEWTIPSLDDGIGVLAEHHIRVTDHVPGAYVFTHPRDLHGLCLELTTHHFTDDDRDRAGWTPAYWSDEHPLGLTGPVKVRVASRDPERSAADVAALVGRDTYRIEYAAASIIGHGIEFADHSVEFVGSRTSSADDQVGLFLAARGERIFHVELGVRSLEQARAHLSALGVPFTHWGAQSLVVRAGASQGAPIVLTLR